MEKEYILYLDESKSVDNIFVIGGFACKIVNEPNIERKLAELKKSVWKSTNENKTKIFHATDYIRQYPKAFMDLIEIIREEEGIVFATVIKLDELSELFGIKVTDRDRNEYQLVDNPFNIALERIIENYTHFHKFCKGCPNFRAPL